MGREAGAVAVREPLCEGPEAAAATTADEISRDFAASWSSAAVTAASRFWSLSFNSLKDSSREAAAASLPFMASSRLARASSLVFNYWKKTRASKNRRGVRRGGRRGVRNSAKASCGCQWRQKWEGNRVVRQKLQQEHWIRQGQGALPKRKVGQKGEKTHKALATHPHAWGVRLVQLIFSEDEAGFLAATLDTRKTLQLFDGGTFQRVQLQAPANGTVQIIRVTARNTSETALVDLHS
jgi:hypothetical protein